jgi:murein DD-endopeptidase MepM/ murein hydrolase activator NlpD
MKLIKREEKAFIFMLSLLALNSKEAIAIEKTHLDYVKLATLEKDSSTWLISKVVSLPPVQVEQEASSSVPSKSLTPNRTITISPGDTLELIAQRYQTTVSELISSNGIENPDLIWAGQTLKISESKSLTRSSTVKITDKKVTLETVAQQASSLDVSGLIEREKINTLPPPPLPLIQKNISANVPTSSILRWRSFHAKKTVLPSQKTRSRSIKGGESIWRRSPSSSRQRSRPWFVFTSPVSPLSVPDAYLPDVPMKFTGYIWPTSGTLTSGYGWRWGRMHRGVDIANARGTPIWAAADGEVISAGWNDGGYGNLIKLKHADGSVTLYAHNSRILVDEGQIVRQGELIALMGSTGYSTGSHLHFEIHPSGQGAVNPTAYLPR